MLKILPILLVGILILVSGCISNEEPTKSPTETPKPKTSINLDNQNLAVTHIAAVEGTYKKIQIEGRKITHSYTTKASKCKDWLKANCADEKKKEAELTVKELESLTATIGETDFFGLKDVYGGKEPTPGFPLYSIEIKSGNNQKNVTFNVAFNSEEKSPPEDFTKIETKLFSFIAPHFGEYGEVE